MNILDNIIAYKKREVASLTAVMSVDDLKRKEFFDRKTVSLSEFLLDKNKKGIIAEFKRKSPSRGIINSEASVIEVTSGYFNEGASGISVLTDNHFFGGSSSDLLLARRNSFFPILRKDFIIDEYQVFESKASGADAILLIAAVLTKQEILVLARSARTLGLEVLLEIHDQAELGKINRYINIVGVNNRDLKTFKTNTDISLKLSDKIPENFLKISESGINSVETIRNLREAGYDGFLMGEKFMASPDPVKAFSEFVKDLK